MKHKLPWQVGIISCSTAFNIRTLRLKHFTRFAPTTSCSSASNHWVFLNVSGAANDHGMSRAIPRPPLDPVCSSADISFNIIYVSCHAVLCFYSNSGYTELPFASVVINLSLLISCIPQAFQQGGLKVESCIVYWMHSLSSEAITIQSPWGNSWEWARLCSFMLQW